MKVKIKKVNENAILPTRSHDDDAGWDLYGVSKSFDDDGNVVYGTGIAFEIPKGYVGLLFPRSSNAKKHLLLSNSVGVLDSGFRGEVLFKYKLTYNHALDGKLYHTKDKEYKVQERIGQIIIIPYPEIEFELVDELSETERGAGGYGSTGA